MQRVPLETVPDESWPALRRELAWCFDAPEELWTNTRTRMDEWRMVRGPQGVDAGFGLYRTALDVAGRAVATGGFAAVGVRPEARGQALAGRMMAAGLDLLRDQGTPLAALYPSTLGLYRGVGFEFGGHRVEFGVDLPGLHLRRRGPESRTDLREIEVREIDAAEVMRRYRPRHGHLHRSAGLWERLLKPASGQVRCHGIGREGYVVAWLDNPGPHGTLRIRDWQLDGPEAGLRAWALLASGGTILDRMIWVGAPDDAMFALLPEHGPKVERWLRYMVRVVDPVAAMEQRGWSQDGQLDLELEDAVLPANAGRWRLEVQGGQGRLVPGGSGALRLDARALAALYMGFASPTELSRWSRLSGDAASLEAARRLFAAPVPWMPDFF